MGRAPLGFSPGLRTPRSLATHAGAGTGPWTLARTYAAIIGLLSAQSLISCDITSHLAPRIVNGHFHQLAPVDAEACQQLAEFSRSGCLTERYAVGVPRSIGHPGFVDHLVY